MISGVVSARRRRGPWHAVRVGLIDDAVEHLKAMLVTGELRAGDKLPTEMELAAQLGVSRNSVREAVRALATMRVLYVRQGDGTYVSSLAPGILIEALGFVADLPQDDTVLHFFEVRRCLEPRAAALAATRIEPPRLAELEVLLAQAEELARAQVPDHAALLDNDLRFHALINEASGNPVLAAVVAAMSGRTTRARIWRGVADAGAAARTVGEHRAILDALTARDSDLARLRAEVHIAEVESWLRDHLSPGTPAG
jgi:GntR family transcriptional repressor for pyruvate dehydrogenase complex